MTKPTIFFFLITFLLITSSCQTNQQNKNVTDIPTVNFDELVEQNLKLSSIIDTIEYIPLETNDSLLLRRPHNIKIQGTKVFFTEMAQYPGLYCFDKNGRFISKYTKRGKAEGEFISIIQYQIDSITQQVFLADVSQRKIIVLNDSLQYVTEIRFDNPHILMGFHINKNRNLEVVFDEKEGSIFTRIIAEYSLDGALLNRTELLKISMMDRVVGGATMQNTKNGFVWIDPQSGQLLRYTSTVDTLNKVNFNRNDRIETTNDMVSVNFETGERTALGTQTTSYPKLRLVDYNTTYSQYLIERQKLIISENAEFARLYKNMINDVNNMHCGDMLFSCGDDYYYQSLDAIDLLECNKELSVHPKLNQMINDLNENDNPVIALYRIKKQ